MWLALNAGSATLKFALFEGAAERLRGRLELGAAGMLRTEHGGDTRIEAIGAVDVAGAAAAAFAAVERARGAAPLAGVAHRIVHGGSTRHAPALVDAALVEELAALVPLAPLHQPAALALLAAARAAWPALPHVACFDTAFHHGWSDAARRLPLPRRLYEAGVRRYGFHGLSYAHAADWLAGALPAARRAIVAHLGSGASVAALRDFASVDCSMGYSALDGVPMSTRPGALDPGVLLHLMREEGLDAAALERLLYRESGLRGMSGWSGDVRALLADPGAAAREALAVYAYRIAREIAAMTVALGGIDALLFTGGVGEHAAPVREAIVAPLAHLGLALDTAANARSALRIDARGSAVAIAVLAADEEAVMVREAAALLRPVPRHPERPG